LLSACRAAASPSVRSAFRASRTLRRERWRNRQRLALTGPTPAFLISDELKDFQALLLAFDEMCAAFNELKTVRRRRKDFFADESYSFGIGIDGLAKAFQPLRCVHNASKDTALESPFRELGEEALDGVEPRTGGRREVEGTSGPAGVVVGSFCIQRLTNWAHRHWHGIANVLKPVRSSLTGQYRVTPIGVHATQLSSGSFRAP
jgi:hypothetical protein